MAKMRRSANLDPARAAEIIKGHRTDHLGRDWWDDYGHLPPEHFLDDDYDKSGDLKEPELDWHQGPEGMLPHVRAEYDERNANALAWNTHDEHDLQHSFWPAASASTALRPHGEKRYGLEVGDGGWDIAGHLWYWRLHHQTGPDINDPDHWEQMDVHPDDMPYGEQIAWSPDVARSHAEQALQNHIDRKQQSRPSIGDYDINQIMRDEGFQ
jgi:hypothetical protein